MWQSIVKRLGLFLSLALLSLSCLAIEVRDANGKPFHLDQAASRVIALAPHLVELVYAIGAGDKLVASVSYADYPEAAKKLPRVGSYRNFSVEAIARYKPDLILAWRSSSHQGRVAQLEQLGYKVYWTESVELLDVAKLMLDLGLVLDAPNAKAASQAFHKKYQALKAQYSQQPSVSVFYQVWNQPLQTVSDKHLISAVIRLCGGQNVFSDGVVMAPKINIESVIRLNPEVIVASGMGQAKPEWLDDWRHWGQLQSVRQQQLYFIPPDLIQRHTPRVLDGAQMMCEQLAKARQVYQN